jgi:hypothetical protein
MCCSEGYGMYPTTHFSFLSPPVCFISYNLGFDSLLCQFSLISILVFILLIVVCNFFSGFFFQFHHSTMSWLRLAFNLFLICFLLSNYLSYNSDCEFKRLARVYSRSFYCILTFSLMVIRFHNYF